MESAQNRNARDEDICALLARGHRTTAFELLVERYQTKVCRLAYSLLGNTAHAEEVTQDIFLKLWQVLERFGGKASLSTWIYTIARNTCLSHIRSENFRRTSPLGKYPEPAAAPTREEMQLEIGNAVAKLPEEQSRVIRLFYLQEHSVKEVAAMLGIPEGTVKSHLHHARKNLGQRLEVEPCSVILQKR